MDMISHLFCKLVLATFRALGKVLFCIAKFKTKFSGSAIVFIIYFNTLTVPLTIEKELLLE